MSTKARRKLGIGPASPIRIRCQRGWEENSPGSPVAPRRGLAGHLHISAQRQQAYAVIGVAAPETKEALAKADRENFDPNAKEFRDGKVAEFMHEHHDAQHDQHGNEGGKSKRHNYLVNTH